MPLRRLRWRYLVTTGALLVGLASVNDAVLTVVWWVALSTLLTPSILAVLEAAWSRIPAAPLSRSEAVSVRPTSVVVSAYLPNEQTILIETVRHIVQTIEDEERAELVVVYNTPTPLSIEKDLQDFAVTCPRVRVLAAHASESKAENINVAMSSVRGEFVAMFDADSRITPTALRRAMAHLAAGGDFCQGANVVALNGSGWLERLVAAEFLEKFFVSYQGRWNMAKVAYFCGSNGYGSRRFLGGRFSSNYLVEDIEYSIRATLSGRRVTFDPRVIAQESAPPNWSAWWRQRMRWAIGWRQVATSYKWRVWTSDLRITQKLLWAFLLHWRRLVLPLALVAFVAVSGFASVGSATRISLGTGWAALLMGSWVAATVQAFAVLPALAAARGIRRRDILAYTALFPFYDLLRSGTMVLACFLSHTRWHVTPRGSARTVQRGRSAEPQVTAKG
jgi:cellulose synthase/poly-beta-1,6-N-acetylglucosamine synthase-like glycosyltransferase